MSRESGPAAEEALEGVRHALADDLNAPRAIGIVDHWVDAQLAHGGPDAAGPGLMARTVDALLGISI